MRMSCLAGVQRVRDAVGYKHGFGVQGFKLALIQQAQADVLKGCSRAEGQYHGPLAKFASYTFQPRSTFSGLQDRA